MSREHANRRRSFSETVHDMGVSRRKERREQKREAKLISRAMDVNPSFTGDIFQDPSISADHNPNHF